MVSRFAVAAAIAAFLLNAPMALAQTCASLRSERYQIEADRLGLSDDFPRTSSAIFTCLKTNEEKAKSLQCASGFMLAACTGITWAECGDLGERWRTVQRRFSETLPRRCW